jgi:G3E family GTPase
MESTGAIPITIITGFLGAGKTTLILNLIPQLPPTYRIALLKNEFGDVAIDSQLAETTAISGVKELLNGCICCNLVGSLQDALETLRTEQTPDRIMIETSGSAFPATLAMEVNRLGRATGNFVLDGVITVLDVENWKGYEDTSITAKLQAQYTDLLILSKWEHVSERDFDTCIDRILDLDLDIPTPRIKSDGGWVDKDLLLGLDAKLAKTTDHGDHKHATLKHDQDQAHDHAHDHAHDQANHENSHGDHHGEVEVLSLTISGPKESNGIDLEKLEHLLTSAPKDEVYRIKAILYALDAPTSSTGDYATEPPTKGIPHRYILNWAFGRWTFTASETNQEEPLLRMTIVTAKYEGNKWQKRVKSGEMIAAVDENSAELEVVKIS